MADLNQLLRRLCDAEIEFVIVGGFAAVLHGSTLVTRDLDVCTVLTDANVERLRTGAVDFVTAVSGVGDFRKVYDQAVTIEPFGRSCRVMSLVDLIAARELESIAERLKTR